MSEAWTSPSTAPTSPAPAVATGGPSPSAPPAGRLRWWSRLAGLSPVLPATLAGAFSLLASRMLFGGIPHIQDSINYLWQARLFAAGHLSLPSHPLAEFFTFRFMVNDGRWYSLFQPGWPALLALGELFEVPWLVSPLVGGLLVVATWGLAREVAGRRVGQLAAWLLACSPFFLFLQAEFMAHGASALLATGAAWSYLAGRRRERPLLLGLAGVSLGLLFLTRSLDAVVLLVPLGLEGVVALGRARPRPWRGLVLFALGGLALGSLQFAYNRALTGDPLVWPQDRYFALTEPQPDCHRLGFGRDVGCVREHGPDLPPGGGFTPRRALTVTGIRLGSLVTDLWGPGPGLLLAVLGLVGLLVTVRPRRGALLLLALALGPVIGYFFYYYHGNCLGARYYYNSLPALVTGVAYLLLRLGGWSVGPDGGGEGPAPSRPRRDPRWWLRRASALLLLLSLLGTALVRELPARWPRYAGAFWGVHDGLGRLIRDTALTDAIVFVPRSSRGPDLDDRDYRIGFVQARPFLEQSAVVVARDLGPANPQLAAAFPGRRTFRYLPWSPPAGVGQLRPLPLDAREPERSLRFEAEDKFPPPRRWGGSVRIQPLGEGERSRRAPAGVWLLAFAPEREGAGFSFRQQIFASGRYRLSGVLARGPEHGLVEVAVDGVPLAPLFDGFAGLATLGEWQAQEPIQLHPGPHWVTFTVVGRSPASAGLRLGVDRMQLTRVDAPGGTAR